MNNTLIDNSTQLLSMQETITKCLSTDDVHTVSIATGYWDIPGLALLVDKIDAFLKKEGTKLRLLIGKDPYVYANQLKKPKVKSPLFPDDYIKTDINNLELKDEYMRTVNCLLYYCTPDENSKVEIRVYRTNANEDAQFLHSKCYIFIGDNNAVGIVGSSNFTQKGLNGNAELNYMETDWMRVAVPETGNPNQKSHVMWFEEKWQQSQPWNKTFLEQILRPSPIAKKAKEIKEEAEQLSPYEIYIKYLQLQFGDITDETVTAQLKSYLPKTFEPYSYQLDAVKQCFYIMKAHGGFFLSDVVGLGKTLVGVLVIKKFIAEAELWNRHPKVLIVTPPAIKKAWMDTIEQFDKDDTFKIASNIEFITTGSIGRLITDEIIDDEEFEGEVKSSDYGLILIDESHNFRNSWTQKYATLDNLIDRIQLQTGYQPLIGLLSATPQNNSPADLKNQIYFFQRSHNSTTLPDIPGGKLDSYFNEKQKLFMDNRNSNTAKSKQIIKEIAADIHDKVLQYLMVRRTRSDIKNQYAEDSEQLKFPSIKGPKKVEYEMSARLSKLFYDTVFAVISDLGEEESIGFYRYAAISYLQSEKDRKLYERRNLTVDRISKQLAEIMKLLLVKRLESSFPAFVTSLKNLKQNTQNMIDMIKADTVFICPDIDVNETILKEGGLEKATPVLRKKLEKKGGNNKEFRAKDLKEKEYLKLLEQDLQLIDNLCKRWEKNTEDPKFDKFKEILDTELFNPKINNPHHYDNPRVVVFTEALDTLYTLESYVKEAGHRPLVVSAKDRDIKQQLIIENFDANYPKELQRDDYDVIITTEVLAEGVNLHRANVILNYDAPWNATRLMQRIGRVNRIGSKEDFVYVFNFYPSEDGEKIIKYLPKAYAKLQAFHTMFGEDNKVFSEMEELSEADLNNLVDGDTSPFAPYINELKQFAKEHPERYQLICHTDARQLGSFRVVGLNHDLFYVGAENHQFVHILIDKDNNPQIVSPLRFIEAFQMAEDKNPTIGKTDMKKYEEKAQMAVNTFNAFVSQSKKAKDAKKIKNSLEQWKYILDMLTDKEAKLAMKNVRKAIENQNTIAIKLTKQLYDELKQGEQSIFGLDADVNGYVKTTFAHISQIVKQKYGEPYVSIYQMKSE